MYENNPHDRPHSTRHVSRPTAILTAGRSWGLSFHIAGEHGTTIDAPHFSGILIVAVCALKS